MVPVPDRTSEALIVTELASDRNWLPLDPWVFVVNVPEENSSGVPAVPIPVAAVMPRLATVTSKPLEVVLRTLPPVTRLKLVGLGEIEALNEIEPLLLSPIVSELAVTWLISALVRPSVPLVLVPRSMARDAETVVRVALPPCCRRSR